MYEGFGAGAVSALMAEPFAIRFSSRNASGRRGSDADLARVSLIITPETPIDGRSVAEAILNGQEPEQSTNLSPKSPVFNAIYRNANEPEELAAHVMIKDGALEIYPEPL